MTVRGIAGKRNRTRFCVSGRVKYGCIFGGIKRRRHRCANKCCFEMMYWTSASDGAVNPINCVMRSKVFVAEEIL